MNHPDGNAPATVLEKQAEGPASTNGSNPRSTGPALFPAPLPMTRLLGVDLHVVTESQANRHILDELAASRGGVVVTPNLDHLRRCRTDMSFAAIVSEAELVVADGMPLIWASRLQGTPLPERVAGSDLILTLSAAAAKEGRSIFLLGGAPGTAEGASEVLKARNPGIRVVGTYCPPVGFESNEAEMARMIAALVGAKPEIVFVALGSPKQELLIERIRANLPGAWWLGVGVSFSFLTGHVQRAPRLLQRTGLEWIHRLLQEPKRLARRYLLQGLPFAGLLFAHAASQRFRRLFGQPTDIPARRPSRRHNGPTRSAPAPLGDLLEDAFAGMEGGNASQNDVAVARVVDGAAPRVAANLRGSRDLSDGGGLSRLRSIVLLAGQLRPSPLQLAVNRSILDLPVLEDRTLINHWVADSMELAAYAKLERLSVKLLVSRQIDEPTSVMPRFRDRLTVERDASDYRGTGGVIADIARRYDDDDFILVGTAAQLLLEPLPALASALDHKRCDAAMSTARQAG
jgi:N-acetylglucosaminyldiphosphoundecaprenol N-acetyl-beta-D-mannosaminyltransferase